MHWGMDIFKHYGIPGDVNRGTLGNYGYGYGYGYGGYGAYYGHYGYPMHRGPVKRRPLHKNL